MFWRKVVSALTNLADEERQAVVFVHGYNVSFKAAALRAAQIGFDLSIKGAMAFFSWPSQGRLNKYAADEATIEASEAMITDFLSSFVTRSSAKAVHIIAHSMGNRGVLRAVDRIAAQAQKRASVPFGQIVLAAADVDADLFRQLSAGYAQVCHRATLYVSERDRAVEASRWLHQYSRAGLTPPVCIVPGIDTVNVTNTDITVFGHGYVGSAREVLQDMHELIFHGTPPGARFGMRAESTSVGDSYWTIGK
jgi:esterase/lipase superfamily enzyme